MKAFHVWQPTVFLAELITQPNLAKNPQTFVWIVGRARLYLPAL